MVDGGYFEIPIITKTATAVNALASRKHNSRPQWGICQRPVDERPRPLRNVPVMARWKR